MPATALSRALRLQASATFELSKPRATKSSRCVALAYPRSKKSASLSPTTVELKSGKTIHADVYLPCFAEFVAGR